jgi:magnesium-transporting ATPase (P-type)
MDVENITGTVVKNGAIKGIVVKTGDGTANNHGFDERENSERLCRRP